MLLLRGILRAFLLVALLWLLWQLRRDALPWPRWCYKADLALVLAALAGSFIPWP